MRKIDELKLRRKELASEIKSEKVELKTRQRMGDCSTEMRALHYKQAESRALHIAYCELRGRTRDEIEKPRENNAPNEYMIRKFKEQYAWETEQEIQK